MSFGNIIPDSVQLHYSLSTASLQLPHSFPTASILIGHYILNIVSSLMKALEPVSSQNKSLLENNNHDLERKATLDTFSVSPGEINKSGEVAENKGTSTGAIDDSQPPTVQPTRTIRIGIITVSDRAHQKIYDDESGPALLSSR